jgi:hypothetical protein
VFDIHANKVHFLDPVHNKVCAEVHNEFKTTFIRSLARCFQAFYANWVMSPENEWEFNYPVSAAILLIGKFGSFVDPYVLIPSGLSFNCLSFAKTRNDRGICMLHMPRHFNGNVLEEICDQVN